MGLIARIRSGFADTEVSQQSQRKSEPNLTRGGILSILRIAPQSAATDPKQALLTARKDKLIEILRSVDAAEPKLVCRILESKDDLDLKLIAVNVFGAVSKRHGEAFARIQVNGAMQLTLPARRWFTTNTPPVKP